MGITTTDWRSIYHPDLLRSIRGTSALKTPAFSRRHFYAELNRVKAVLVGALRPLIAVGVVQIVLMVL